MKLKYIIAGMALAGLSLTGNLYSLAQLEENYKKERKCAQDDNVYGCEWVLVPKDHIAKETDPIGKLIKESEQHSQAELCDGILCPPKTI